jgi:hypothetical protein
VLSFNGVLFFIDTIFYLTPDFYISWVPPLSDSPTSDLEFTTRSLERGLRLTRSRLRPTTLSSPVVERGFCI